MINDSAVVTEKKFHVNPYLYVFSLKFCHYQFVRKYRLNRSYVYHEHRLSFPIVYQSYHIVRVYCSIVR